MDISVIERKVRERFEAGFNCAESVFLVVTEAFGHHAPEQARLATAFACLSERSTPDLPYPDSFGPAYPVLCPHWSMDIGKPLVCPWRG